MAHFAKISETNEVLMVVVLNNSDMLNADGVETESIGQTYLEKHNNWPAHLWIQTSYNTINNTHKNGGTAFRGNYAGIGFIWDSINNMFFYPKPYPSWVKNLEFSNWVSPIGECPELTDEQKTQNTRPNTETPASHSWGYSWNEDNQSWDLTNSYA